MGPEAGSPHLEAIQTNTAETQRKISQSELEQLPPRERAGRFLEGTIKFANDRLDTLNGKDAASLSDQEKTSKGLLETAVTYDAAKGVNECSPALRAMLDSDTFATGQDNEGEKYAQRQLRQLTRVQVDDQEYTYDEWQKKKLEMPDDAARAEAESKAMYGFRFPEESKQEEAGDATQQEKTPLENATKKIRTQAKTLEQAIHLLPANSKERAEKEQQIKLLNAAADAEGPMGVFLKKHALESLKASKIGDVDAHLEAIKPDLEKAQEKLKETFKSAGVDEAKSTHWQNILTEKGVAGLFDDQEFMKLVDNAQIDIGGMFFGDKPQEVIDAHLEDLATAFLTKEDHERLKSMGKKLGKGSLVALLIVALVAAGVSFAAMGTIGSGMLNSYSKQ